MNNVKKNTSIELTRFLFALFIALHHSFIIESRIFGDGWIFTEFFFMVTGYFTTKHFDNYNSDDVKEAFTYTANKIKDILPIAYVGIFLGFFYHISNLKFFSFETFYALCQLPLNLLFLYPTKIVKNSFCQPLWYVGAILYMLPIVIWCQIKFKRAYKYLLSWMIPMFGYSFLITKFGTITNWTDGIAVSCFLRAICGICLGSVAFYVKDFISIKKSFYMLTYVLQILAIALLIYISNSNHDEMYMEAIFSEIFLLLLYVTRGNSKVSENPVFYNIAIHLGKLSVPIYCLNVVVFSWVKLLSDNRQLGWSYERLTFISFVAIIGLAEIYLKLKAYLKDRYIMTKEDEQILKKVA